jgi:Flp pilus assembly pilin Flp
MQFSPPRFFRAVADTLRDDSGQGLVEYAIIIALVSIVAIATLRTLGHRVDNSLGSATNGFS